jgi:hypothetical protein
MACAGAPGTSGAAGQRPANAAAAPAAGRPARDIEPAVCSGCEPPLTYGGGPVMATHSPEGTTVVPVYWIPKGWRSPFPVGFQSTINRFIANVAAASGRTDNVFSVATEYYSNHSGVRAEVAYKIRPGPVITDTSPFPTGCEPLPRYTACVTDGAIRTELSRLTRARGLPANLDHLYAVFFPPQVETRGSDGTSSDDDFCAYHQAFRSGKGTIVYANQPFDQSNCGSGQTPNGSADADNELGNLSHEIIEAMTDPLITRRAWDDATGNEIADICALTFGRPLGFTRRSDPNGSLYNQVINGGRYYLPQEFSNQAFERFGLDRGCILSEKTANSATAAALGTISASPHTFVLDATPTTLPADGTAKATVTAISAGAKGNGLGGDRIHFSVGTDGLGQCGTLSRSDENTAANGRATVTYTASKKDVPCWVLANEAEGGRAAEALVYQGSAGKLSPTIRASFPRALQAGGKPVMFSLTAANPSPQALLDTLTHFVIHRAGPSAASVNANQVRLAYSTKGQGGPFVPVPLVGSTRRGEIIQGYVGRLGGSTLRGGDDDTLTLRISLTRSTPGSTAGPLIAFQAFLVQTNPGDGSDVTLADSDATDATIQAAPPSNIWRSVLIGLVALLAALAGGWFIWRRRKRPRAPLAAASD